MNFTLQANGYAAGEVRRVFHSKETSWADAEEERVMAGTAFLPYIKRVIDSIGELLESHRVRLSKF